MPVKLPIRFPSTRVKSPAARTRPNKPPASSTSTTTKPSRRARSVEPDRRRRSPSRDRRPSRAHDRTPERDHRNDRQRRRRDSSVSPASLDRRREQLRRERYEDDRRGRRASAAAVEDDVRQSRTRPLSARYPSSPGRRHDAPPSRDSRRPSTPDQYRHRERRGSRQGASPSPKGKKVSSPSPAAASPAVASSPAAAAAAPAAPAVPSLDVLFAKMPTAVAAYAGIKELSKHADTAKEWASWLSDLNEAPEEIQSLSDKASTARETIDQFREMVESQPELLQDKKNTQLIEQINAAIENTDKALGKMTKLLSDISKKGTDHGNVINGIEDYWRSYRYRDEFEEKVKAADDELQKEISMLSTLMVPLLARAINKKDHKRDTADKGAESPRSPRASSPPARSAASAKAADELSKPVVPTIVEPPIGEHARRRDYEDVEPKVRVETPSPLGSDESSLPPRSPSAVSREEADIAAIPIATAAAAAAATTILRDDTRRTSRSRSPRGETPLDSPRAESVASQSEESSASKKEAQDALLDAAWDGTVDDVAKALRHAPVTSCDIHGLTPLLLLLSVTISRC